MLVKVKGFPDWLSMFLSFCQLKQKSLWFLCVLIVTILPELQQVLKLYIYYYCYSAWCERALNQEIELRLVSVGDERVFGCAKAFYLRAPSGLPCLEATFTSCRSLSSTKHVV